MIDKDILGDVNTGTIVDGNGLSGIIGGSSGTTSSSDTSQTSDNTPIYKPDNTYYKDDLDIVASYEQISNGRYAVVLTFCMPGGQSNYWDIDFAYNFRNENTTGYCTYSYVGSDVGTWVVFGYDVKEGTMRDIIPDKDGFIKIYLHSSEVIYTTDEDKAACVSNFLESEWSIKVYNKRSIVPAG